MILCVWWNLMDRTRFRCFLPVLTHISTHQSLHVMFITLTVHRNVSSLSPFMPVHVCVMHIVMQVWDLLLIITEYDKPPGVNLHTYCRYVISYDLFFVWNLQWCSGAQLHGVRFSSTLGLLSEFLCMFSLCLHWKLFSPFPFYILCCVIHSVLKMD